MAQVLVKAILSQGLETCFKSKFSLCLLALISESFSYYQTCLICHLTDFSVYSLIQLELSLRQLQSNIILLLEFVLDVDFSLFTCGELDKEERKARV